MKKVFLIILCLFVCIACTHAQNDEGKKDIKFDKKLICPFEKGMGREPKEAYRWDSPDMKIILISQSDTLVRSCINAKVSNIQPAEDGQYELVIYYKNYYFWYSGVTKVLVKINQTVKSGEVLGVYTKGRELEFRMFKNEEPMDPREYLDCVVNEVKEDK